MSRHLPRLRAAAALVASMMALVPLAGDVHFATTEHRWCPIHHHIEDLQSSAPRDPGPTRQGVSKGERVPRDTGNRCPVLTAMRPVPRPLVATPTPAAPAPDAPAIEPARVDLVRAILDRAPKHGPPAA